MTHSILDDLGEEVTGIVSPVSICMALTVVLVRLLNPEGESDSSAVYIAQAFYSEQEGDSTAQKLSGSIINALIFVGVVTIMTFALVLLFKYGCTKIIYGYMGFSAFSIFFLLTGIIALELLQKASVHLDWITFTYVLLNFAMVGSVTLFFFPAPLLMKQCYLIITGIAVAYVFTWIPEWTTWILLISMAIYDVCAVLMPGGPLKVLVEMAQEREEEIPALVYQARPSQRRRMRQEAMDEEEQEEEAYRSARQGIEGGIEQQQQRNNSDPVANNNSINNNALPVEVARLSSSSITTTSPYSDGDSSTSAIREMEQDPSTPLIPVATATTNSSSATDATTIAAALIEGGGHVYNNMTNNNNNDISGPAPLFPPPAQQRVGAGVLLTPAEEDELRHHPEEATVFSLPESIKLGLGDFIFYSVLVGRAAMYDWFTVFACYLAIIAGLGCTLLWLALAKHALPALPISIAVAVAFYFISRYVMEPVILPMTLNLVYF
jgi:presenilin 1